MGLFVANIKAEGSDWELYHEDENIKFYYDVESIRRTSPDIARVWTKHVYVKPKFIRNREVRESILLDEINCLKKTTALYTIIRYGVDGNVINSRHYDTPQLEHIAEDSIHEIVYNNVCHKN